MQISLTGQVHPVGGVREKVVAAIQAGMTHVALPEGNRADFELLPDYITENIQVHYLTYYLEILPLVFPNLSLDVRTLRDQLGLPTPSLDS